MSTLASPQKEKLALVLLCRFGSNLVVPKLLCSPVKVTIIRTKAEKNLRLSEKSTTFALGN